ncbi:hypothetical protein [Streptomyces sp. NPDC001315]|uniref:hypothetical protein n=1 Tax=Streptomyces sp. NPDC001315 TaxID=3364562 RepID=UPI003693795E
MSPETVAPLAALERHTPAVARLTSLTSVFVEDLDRGSWTPGPLERTLAARLLLACAGDGQFTPFRVRETLLDGSVALTYAGGGRLARLLAQLLEVTTHPAPGADSALDDAARLLERAARDIPAPDEV